MRLLQLFYTPRDIVNIGRTLDMDRDRNHPIVQAVNTGEMKVYNMDGISFRYTHLPIDNKLYIMIHNTCNDSNNIFKVKRIS